MATTVTAHRQERRLIGVNFADDLPTGATISSVDSLTVLNAGGQDKTTEIRGVAPGTPSIVGALVSFWKEIASGREQAVGRYRVKLRVLLSNAEKPIALGEGNKLIYLQIVGD